MSDSIITYILAPAVTAIVGGIGYLVKYILEKRDNKHEEEIAERNEKRAEILATQEKHETEINGIKRDLAKMQSIILACDKKDCPSKLLLANYLNKKADAE